jgi:hypothetical protein
MAGLHSLLHYRPAFPDEAGRAKYVDGAAHWPFPQSGWFLAIRPGSAERIVAVIRYAYEATHGGETGTLHFRFSAAGDFNCPASAGEFLASFERETSRLPHQLLRHVRLIPAGHLLETTLERAGFSIRYCETRLEAPWAEAAARVNRIAQAIRCRERTIASAAIVAARDLQPEAILPLLEANHLMSERELRELWSANDPSALDLDVSSALTSGGKTLGVILCAEAGDSLRVLAAAGDSENAGARSGVIPLLMDHSMRLCSGRVFRSLMFRANPDAAIQTVNLALRSGGKVMSEMRRWAKDVPG